MRVEAEGEHRNVVLLVESPDAGERLQLGHIPDRHRHISTGAADREVEVVAVLLRTARQLELYSREGELEGDALVLDAALALDGKRRAGHRHSHVHCSEAMKDGARR